MAIHYRTKGFILKKNDLWETDRIFTVFTKDFGKLGILGRAIRKIKSKLRSGMRLFSLANVEFIQGKTYKTLTDASLIEEFSNLRKDLKRLKITYDIAEILDNLVRGEQRDEKIWMLLRETFQILNKPSISVKECWLAFYYFLWNFLAILGYRPELELCSICQKKLVPKNLYFASQEGGTICFSCFKKTKKGKKIDPGVIKILRLILSKNFDILKKLKVKNFYKKAIKEVSEDYLSWVDQGSQTKSD